MIGLALAVAVAASPPEVLRLWRYGGDQSCATWLSSEAEKYAGEHWITGFWTGLNFNNPKNHTVGGGIDAEGIVAEIKLVCRAEPSRSLLSATVEVYRKLEAAQ